jgi:hypothetical protein
MVHARLDGDKSLTGQRLISNPNAAPVEVFLVSQNLVFLKESKIEFIGKESIYER